MNPEPRKLSANSRWLGLLIATGWSVFWIWFNLAAGFGERDSEGWGVLRHHIIIAAIVAVVLTLAWCNVKFGRFALIGVGLLAAALFRNPRWFGTQWLVPFILVLPPLLAGILLWNSDKSQPKG
jgi:hypothetical protein